MAKNIVLCADGTGKDTSDSGYNHARQQASHPTSPNELDDVAFALWHGHHSVFREPVRSRRLSATWRPISSARGLEGLNCVASWDRWGPVRDRVLDEPPGESRGKG
jgi:hypothetical protein